MFAIKLRIGLLALGIAGYIAPAFSQSASMPQAPQMQSFRPVLAQPQAAAADLHTSIPMPDPTGQVQIHMGSTADDILRQANRANPSYGYGNDPASHQLANEAQVRARMANDPAYNPALRNGVSSNVSLSKYEEIHTLLQESTSAESPATGLQNISGGYYKTAAFAAATKGYTNALQHLEKMLSGKENLSVAQAYFDVENAYGESYLNQTEFNALLNRSASFIHKWMQQQRLDPHNNEDVQLAIQKFMGEQLTVYASMPTNMDKGEGFKATVHSPLFYDYDDYQGEKDCKKFFLTKCLATGSGQCASMPAVYLSLAEALGAKAYLTFAPQHTFIKYADNAGNIVNYEPTSNWKMSDNWYRDNMFITPAAKRNHVYLDTLNSRQIIGDCIVSLGLGYLKKFGVADAGFVSECISVAAAQYPYDNIQVRFLRSSMLARMLAVNLYQARIQHIKDLDRSPQAKQLYQQLQQNEEQITALGYKPEPTQLYNQLLQEHEFRGKMQDSLHINSKAKRNLFSETK